MHPPSLAPSHASVPEENAHHGEPSPPGRVPPLWSTARPLGRAGLLGFVATALGAAVALGVPLCTFALITRHPCPGCGLTRATLALAQGHVHEALHFHPLVMVVSPLFIAAFSYNAVTYVTQGRWAATEGLRGRWTTGLGLLIIAALVAVWIARFFGAFGGPVPV